MDPNVALMEMQQEMLHLQRVVQSQQQQIAAVQQPAAPSGGGAVKHGADRPRLPAPTAFEGSAASLDDWLCDLRQQFDWYTTVDDAGRLAFATAFLRSAARDWWSNLAAAIRPKTWTDFEAALRRRFQPVTSAETARSKLLALSQGKGHVNDYIEAFRRLLSSVPTMDAEDRLFQFLRGLRSNISTQIRVQGIRTLDAAVEAAARIGSLGEMTAATGSSLSSSSNHVPMDLGTLGVEGGVEGLEPATSTDRPEDATPITKADLQHLLNAMRDERKGPASSSNSSKFSRNRMMGRGMPRIPHLTPLQVSEYMDAGKCFGCGSKEHRSRNCPKRRIGIDGKVTWLN
jgi:hypothetical protein